MFISFLVIISMISNASACIYHHSDHAVDSGKKMHWGGSVNSSFTTELNAGIATWNAMGKVKIEKDTVLTIQDLDIYYVNSTDPKIASAPAVYNKIDKKITFYKPVLNSFTLDERKKVATHELGHALGITEIDVLGNVMKQGRINQTTLGPLDKTAYNCSWG